MNKLLQNNIKKIIKQEGSCDDVYCTECGIYSECHGGSDEPDLSVLEIAKKKLMFIREKKLERIIK